MDTSDTNSTEKPARPQNDRDVAESLADQSEEAPPARQLHGLSWSLVVASILTTTFLFGLDNTIVADVQPAIVAQFGSVDRLPWLSVAFLVSAASTTVFW